MPENMSFSLLFLLTFLLLSPTNASDDILYHIEFIITVYKNGTIERLSGTEIVPPSFDPTVGVQSKDIVIHPTLNISARLYLPINGAGKLPLVIYFHGGGFFTGSPFSIEYHNYLNSIVGKANAVAVSVNYQLAPEHPLPIAYQDSWLALKWVFSHQKGNGKEAWLNKYVDFERVYLGGDSAGGNIAHNIAIRVGSESEGIKLHGMFLNCPHFWGTKRIGNEDSHPKGEAWVESIWIHAYPNSTGFDDPKSNPGMDPGLSKLGCKEVVVYVAELDVLRDRGWYYAETLMKRSKWDGIVKVFETKGEKHGFDIIYPNSPNTKKIIDHLALFLNGKLVCDWGLNYAI